MSLFQSSVFFIKKVSASDCSCIVLIFRAISASMFLISLFVKKNSVLTGKASNGYSIVYFTFVRFVRRYEILITAYLLFIQKHIL